jgi:hypothetical protein
VWDREQRTDASHAIGAAPVRYFAARTTSVLARGAFAVEPRAAREAGWPWGNGPRKSWLLHTWCSGIFRLAQGRGLCRDNPAIPVREVLPRRRQVGRRPALLTFEELRVVLSRAETAMLSPSVRLANRLCAFTASTYRQRRGGAMDGVRLGLCYAVVDNTSCSDESARSGARPLHLPVAYDRGRATHVARSGWLKRVRVSFANWT